MRTVPSLIFNSLLTSLLERPFATSAKISISRGESLSVCERSVDSFENERTTMRAT